MFGQLNSTALLVKAEKADATFEKAMAAAQKARAAAARQRILAARVEADEEAALAEKKAFATSVLVDRASQDYQLAVCDLNAARNNLKTAEQNAAGEKAYLLDCATKHNAATLVADAARASVPVTENESVA